MDEEPLCLDEAPDPIFKLRGRQPEWLETIKVDLTKWSRLLVVAPGGVGKTGVMGQLAKYLWKTKGIRTLVLENRDRLTEQTAKRIRDETGLEVDVEKGSQRASPYAPVVVACVQSISKIARLTAFASGHFGLVIPDECHLALSDSWLRVIRYHHYGAESLSPEWKQPEDGKYSPRCSVVGFTASPDLGDKRNLGELFQHQSVNYSYMDAIDEGWLVGIKEINVPVKIDTRHFRKKHTSEGDAFNVADQNAALLPIIKELAEQIVRFAPTKKGICFVPSVEVARQMSDALNGIGIPSTFVSGECLDKGPKTDAFHASKSGWLVNCCLYNYGVDFPDVTAIAIFGAMISKVKYLQSVFRGTRVLPGLIHDGMTAEERRAAIASSGKQYLTLLSPFFISDKIQICEPFDLFGIRPEGKKKVPPLRDFTDPAKIRDYIKAMEKAASKHANRQPRTINPVVFALSLGDSALAHYVPETAADAAPPSDAELDYLLAAGISTVDIKNSGEAQQHISRLKERDRLGLATPLQLTFLRRLGIPDETATLMRKTQAGAIIGQNTAKWRTRPAMRGL